MEADHVQRLGVRPMKLTRQGLPDLSGPPRNERQRKPDSGDKPCPHGFGSHDWRYVLALVPGQESAMWCRRCGARQ
jgi:hypothetical protein